MPISLNRHLCDDRLQAIEARVRASAENDHAQATLRAAKPLVKAQRHQREAARLLARLIEDELFDHANSLSLLDEIFQVWCDDPDILAIMGEATESARDIDYLNDAPSDHSLFAALVDRLQQAVAEHRGTELEFDLTRGLVTAGRMISRQYDTLVEAACKSLVTLKPESPGAHYTRGLFLKTRGQFREGFEANRRAIELNALKDDEIWDAAQWNQGICATGAGLGEEALAIWLGLGNKITMGRFDLPEGGYPSCKVRLAQRPLAQRDRDHDDPGQEETIWVERLSPCHGVIRSVLYHDLGVDFGDVVLFDGAPVTYHQYGDETVPVFPHLATLLRNNYHIYDFSGTQEESGQLHDLSLCLDDDGIVYVHSEQMQTLCRQCWSNPDLDHGDHQSDSLGIVNGRIAVPPKQDPAELLNQLDQGMQDSGCRLFSPSLCLAAGQTQRATTEQRRVDMINQTS